MRRRGAEKETRDRKAARPKRRIGPRVTHRRGASTADLQEQLDHRTRELHEALEQQTATAEILRVISSSPTDVQHVFDTIVRNFVALCGSIFGTIFTFDGKLVHLAGAYGFSPEQLNEVRKKYPVQVSDRSVLSARAILAKAPVHIQDTMSDPHYDREHAAVGGARRMLAVPMLREGAPLGAIVAAWAEAGATPKQHEHLLKVFADQAVITIENTRLLSELRESLQQQTATAEVLKVISRSTFDLQTVLDTLTASAARLCDADFAFIYQRFGDLFHLAAIHGFSGDFIEYQKQNPIPLGRGSLTGRTALERKMVHIPDVLQDPEYTWTKSIELAQYRTMLGIPLLREGVPIGVIALLRRTVRPFTDKQIELVKTFADQAVIAIQNVRLFEEVQARTRDLSEALEQQTATSEVLKVISGSPGGLEPVFNAMLSNATRICEAKFGTLYLRDADGFRAVAATRDAPPAYVEARKRELRLQPSPDGPLGRAASTKQVVHMADIMELQSYRDGYPFAVDAVELGKFRTALAVPMLKNDELIGVITIMRQEVRPFTDKQIELVKNFAAQAVIAIENTRLLNELRESLQQQTATAEVLKVISSSPGDMKPVFEAMLANALRICEAKFGHLLLYDGESFHASYLHDVPPAYREFWEQHGPIRPSPNTGLARLASTKQVAHIPDLKADSAYVEREPLRVVTVEQAGARSLLAVPMLKENKLIGAIVIYRQEVRPFTGKQIALVQNFAAQAVIAIENTRLLNELRQRTDDLSEALEQQTATSEVLKVISSSPGELKPVFESMLENAVRICEAKFGILFLTEGDAFRTVALYGAPPAFAEARQREPVIRAGPGISLHRAAISRQPVQVADIQAEPTYTNDPQRFAILKLAGARTVLSVPMLKDDWTVGVISIYGQEVRLFTDKQIELLKNFAAQAVIAIENTRLLNELRESLDRQTATAEVLKVISSSPGELTPVFNSVLANATQLCEASHGAMWIREGDRLRNVAFHGTLPEAFHELWHAGSVIRADAGVPVARCIRERALVIVEDLKEDKSYCTGEPLARGAVDLAGMRTLIAVPMLKENDCVGAITIYRREVKPFVEKQIELVQNFASQAVIAIENTRLLNELRESLQQQTATADVLKIISRSAFDLQTVLQTLVESAAKLCNAPMATITRPRDKSFYLVASYGFPANFDQYMHTIPHDAGRGTLVGRTLLEAKVTQIDDVLSDPEYIHHEGQRIGGFRTVLGVPLLRDGVAIAVMVLARNVVQPFTDKEIKLVSTFADQAAIAIENVRLFDSVETRTRELAKSLEDLRTAQDRLVQTQKLALLGQLTAGIAHEIKNPLNFVNNFSGISAELIDELKDTLKGIPLDDKARTEINELADTLKSNFDKVVHHGRRADAIVKNMLQHSREGSGEHRVIDINALVEESLNLAWHGARAETQGFEIKLKQSFDPSAGGADVFPQDIRRALLNVISNGFYAATNRRAETDGGDYEPTLTASTKNLGDRVEIKIRDNGAGITPDVKEKMFNPFFTTKPTGEGTGLGLSISHDIIVKQHAGSIEVDTQPGEFTEITVILPRVAALLPERSQSP